LLNPITGAAAFVAAALVSSAASAAPLSYDLVQGQLTAVTVGTTDLTNRLAAPVDLDQATVIADFDPSVLDLNNLFISAAGPGTVTLSGINGWDSVQFSNASLQSSGVSDITADPNVGGVFNFGTAATLTSDLALTNSGGTTLISGYSAQSGATGSIIFGPDGLNITLTGVVLGYLPDPVNSNLFEVVKADLSFSARNLGGQTAIPEPGSQLLFPAGLALLGWVLRRK
jgi:hypothetical protein